MAENCKIKLLCVIPSLQDGGIEALTYKILSNLSKNKFSFHVYCLANIEKGYSYKRFLNIGCEVKTFNFVNTDRRFFNVFTNFYQLVKLSIFMAKNRFDVVHSQDFFSASITRIALIFSRIMMYKPKKCLVTLHNMQYWLKPIHRRLNKFLSVITDNIICVSASVFEFSRKYDKINENKYIIIYNGIETEIFKANEKVYSEERNKLNISKDDFVLGQVGTFSFRKGHKYLLKAFSGLRSAHPNLKLILVGGKRSHEKRILNEILLIIKESNLEDSVLILETRDDIDRIYNMLDLYVMPSIVEGFGLALVEAMSTGKICVVSDIPPFLEIITDSYNGYIFKSKDVDSLVMVIENIISNYSKLGAKISENARKTVVEKFNIDKMVNEYDKVYSQ